ncbi:Gldg family protein [Prosthecobacter sp.]|uniref:Gldg family protein n=1 Tax=Prosthecobacter sp. TaxID=1965333 RepID=UPI003784C150
MSASSKSATAGITALLIVAVIVALNFLVGVVGFGNYRLDLTQDGLFTLSEGTKNILNRINPDAPVTIKFYATNDDRVMPPMLKPHARSIEDLLLEFEKQSDGKVTLEVIHPNPDTDAEDDAKSDEIRGLQVNQEGDHLYLGLTVQSLDVKEVLPFLNPEDASALEYEVARSIVKVIKPTEMVASPSGLRPPTDEEVKRRKVTIGIMSAMPIGGTPSMPFQQQRGPEAWEVVRQIKASYETRDVPMTADKIDSDITVLLVVHPAEVSKTTEFAIDQYLLGGGNVIAFVDPQSLLAQAMSSQPNPMTGQPGNMINTSSDLPNLFKSWGITFQKDMVVTDMNYRGNLQGRLMPTALQLPKQVINQDDRVTAGLQSFTLINAGSLGIERKEGLDVITLATSSENSQMIDTTEADKLRRQPNINFVSSGKKQVVGVRITGKFKTAFPDGKPAAPAGPKDTGGPEQDVTAPGAAAAPAAAPAPAPAAPPPPPVAATPPATAPAPAAPAPAAPPAAVTTPPVSVTTAPVAAPPPPATSAPAAPATAPAAPAPVSVTTPPVSVTTAPVAVPAPGAPAGAPAAPAAPAVAAAPKAPDNSLKESKDSKSNVLLFSDADMLYDAFCMRQGELGVGAVTNGGNLPMLLNAVEVFAGGGDLIQVRNRKAPIRPFTKLKEMREEVEEQYRPRLVELSKERQILAEKLNKARPQLDLKRGTLIVDQATMDNIKEMEKNTKKLDKEESNIRKEVNKKVEYRKTVIKALNVLVVPVFVLLVGLIVAMFRRISTAAA